MPLFTTPNRGPRGKYSHPSSLADACGNQQAHPVLTQLLRFANLSVSLPFNHFRLQACQRGAWSIRSVQLSDLSFPLAPTVSMPFSEGEEGF